MMTHNPFNYNLPVAPADFIGRWPLVEAIVADLSGPRPDSWAVIGGRRFGKSSVLKAVEARLLAQAAQAAPGEWHIFPVSVDLKRCGTGSEQAIYACIIRELARALRRNQTLSGALAGSGWQAALTPLPDRLTFFQFEDSLDDLIRHVEAHRGPLRLVLLLDEVEKAIRFDWVETLFDNLRALIYAGPLANMVKLVLTGSASVVGAKQTGSPLLNAVKIEHLAALPPADMGRLIDRGGPCPPQVSEAVQALSGGHPFIGQYLLHHLWDQGCAGATPAQVDQTARRMRQERFNDFQGWWDAIGAGGRLVYGRLAAAGAWLPEHALAAGRPDRAGHSWDQGLAALCYHGLAVRDESRQHYRAAGALFQDWFVYAETRKLTAQPAQPEHEPGLGNGAAAHIKNLIDIHQRRRQKLEERAAYEGLSSDPHVTMEIEDIDDEIDALLQQLHQLEQEPD